VWNASMTEANIDWPDCCTYRSWTDISPYT
jgi:hypothetical protein